MRTKAYRRWSAALLAALLLMAGCVSASAAVTLDCHLGYNDTVTFLRTIPLQVELTGTDHDLNGTLRMDVQRYDTEFDRYEQPVTTAAGSTVRVTLPVTLTYRQSDYTVQWVENDRVLAQAEIKPAQYIDPTSLIIGVLSDTDKSLSQFEISQTADPLKRAEYWRTLKLTAQSFPSDLESMQLFDLLMVDGFDLSALSDAQQSALDQWLKGGGVAIVGGGAQAAAAFPYFSRYTGISAGALADGGDISQALLTSLKSTEAALGSTVRTVELLGASGAAIGGERALVDVCDVEDGKVLTCAFSLSDAPFADWQGKFALWQRLMLEHLNASYDRMLTLRGIGSGNYYRPYTYVDSSVTDVIQIPNGPGMALPVVLMALFSLLAGFGGYFILKRLDKREWMWVAVPVLALVFSLALWGVSGSLGMQQPVASSYTIVHVAPDGTQSAFTGVSAASARVGRIKLATNAGTIDPLTDNSYYDASNFNQTEQPTQSLRYVLRGGSEPSVEMPHQNAWEQVTFTVQNAPVADCAVSGECALDGDALAFTIRNQSAIAFEPGVIITDYGYVNVEALLPGQSVTARLEPAKKKNIAGGVAADNSDNVSGVLLDDTNTSRYSYYDFFQAHIRDQRELPGANRQLTQLKSFLLNNASNEQSWNGSGNCFHYLAFSSGLCDPELIVDDVPVTRAAQYGMIDVQLSYNPIAKDGSVRFLRGSFPIYTASLDLTGTPHKSSAIYGMYNSFQLNNNDPAFAYDVSLIPAGMKLTRLSLRPNYAYYPYTVSLYNHTTQKWDEAITFNYDSNKGTGDEVSTIKALDGYIGADGMLYAQFRKQGAQEDYAEIGTPILTMDGRLD